MIKHGETEEKKGKELSKVMGIRSTCVVKKSIIDDPFREADIFVVFGYGIDDIRANLHWMKEVSKDTMYDCCGEGRFHGAEEAISFIEKKGMEEILRQKTIGLWRDIEEKFRVERKSKRRK